MKKNALLIALLAGFTGAASAASSVTLYGQFDIGYQAKEINGDDKDFGELLTQDSNNSSSGNLRLGLRGSEDLGNGLSGIFNLEGRFEGDNGEKTPGKAFFDRQSWVGIKSDTFGRVRLGRSYSAMEDGIGFIDTGRRATSWSSYDMVKGIQSRHSNGLFYDYSKSGFTIGGDVTTKGGYNDGLKKNSDGTISTILGENSTNENVAYGVFAGYKDANLRVGLAYQDDSIEKADTIRREWGVAAQYTFAPVTVGVAYATGKDDVATQEGKMKQISANIVAEITKKDNVNAVFRRGTYSVTPTGLAKSKDDKTTYYGIGYVHSLSKRTSVYADVGRNKTKDIDNKEVSGSKYIAWDVAIRHYF